MIGLKLFFQEGQFIGEYWVIGRTNLDDEFYYDTVNYPAFYFGTLKNAEKALKEFQSHKIGYKLVNWELIPFKL